MADTRNAVFISYASQDAEAVRRIADALRAAGVEVWFDQSELVGGDAWDQKIRSQIASCALFVPVISVNTQARLEGYFRIEWKLAAQRTHAMADEKAFLLPVVIDDTRDAEAKVPAEFKAVQWTKLPRGEAAEKFCARVQRLLGGSEDAAVPAPATTLAEKTGKARQRGGLAKRWWVIFPVLVAVAGLVFALRWTGPGSRSAGAGAVPAAKAARSVSGVDSTPTLREICRVLGNRTEIGVYRGGLTAERLKLLDELATRALAETPNNPSAWAVAAEIDHHFFAAGVDVSPARFEQLNQRAARALQLDPGSFDARWARAAMLIALRDAGVLGEAEAILQQLVKEWPEHRGARAALATVLRSEGRLSESGEMSLQNGMPSLAFWAFWEAGEVERAEAAARAIIAGGGATLGRLLLSRLQMAGREDLDGALATMEQIPVSDLLEEGPAMLQFHLRLWRGEGKAALETVQRLPQEWFASNAYVGPRCLLTGLAHDLAGQREAALAEWRKALRLVDERLAERENDGELLRLKANVLARLGETEQARTVAALEAQLSGRPADDLTLTFDTAMLLGQREAVAAWLEKVLRQRGNLGFHARVRFDPAFEAWRGEPWLAKLLRETLPAGAKPLDDGKPAESPPPPSDAKSVAVLPFANLSGDTEQEYFSDGLTEEILNALARERDLRVPGRSSSFSFKGKNVPAAEIAKALNVSRFVEGSVRKSGNKVRISVSLTRASDGFSEELGTFTEELTDIFALQDKVARVVVEKLTQRTGTKTVVSLTSSPEAYDAFLRGRALQTRAAHLRIEAAAHYERAVAIDPAFALAWARLAEARFRDYSGLYDRSPELVAHSRQAIDRALAAQADLPEALIMRANWAREVAFDFTAAQRDLDRAEALQPPTAELRQAQAYLARDQGNWPEALRRAREALELDPQNGDYTNTFALNVYMPRGDWMEADRLFARAMEIQGPGSVNPFRNRLTLRSAWRGPEAALRLIERAPTEQAKLDVLRADVLASLGRTDEARVAVGRIEQQAPAGVRLPLELLATGSTAAGSLPMLEACERQDLARQVAEELRTEALKQMEAGNRAPWVRRSLIQAETTLGHPAVALAALEEWRAEYEKLPSVFRRIHEFHRMAIPLYAALGQADEVVALLRECSANGYQVDFTFDGALYFGPVRDDQRIQEWMKQHQEWKKTLPNPIDL